MAIVESFEGNPFGLDIPGYGTDIMPYQAPGGLPEAFTGEMTFDIPSLGPTYSANQTPEVVQAGMGGLLPAVVAPIVAPLVAQYLQNQGSLINYVQGKTTTASTMASAVASSSEGTAGIGQIITMVTTGNIAGAVALAVAWFGKNKWVAVLLALAALGLISYAIVQAMKSSKEGRAASRKRSRRYSIGANPRLGTLIKVDKRCNTILKRFINQARHAGVLRVPTRTQYVRIPKRGR
jgi:hypothetical protein